MDHIMLPVGIDRFEELRADGCYYIDKTAFIEELLQDRFKVNLITRPRRFGKTLAMSMLAAFFDIRKNSSGIFEGLKISDNEPLCNEWMNQYPVLFLTLKDVDGLSFESAYGSLQNTISDLCIEHSYLPESDLTDPKDKAVFQRLKNCEGNEPEMKGALHTLTRMMQMHHNKQVILLIDEYDVPLAKAYENGFYDQMLDVIRGLIGKVLKTNPFLKFSVITGCLKIAKESIFTGTNNFVTNSISGTRYSKYFGFTAEEVVALLDAVNFREHADKIKTWYDGYRFGSTEVYCPWDVLNYVIDLQSSPETAPGNYWKNTSHNSIIRSFIDRTDLLVNDKFEVLLSGGCIQEEIAEDLTYDVLHSSESNLWSILYLTGYLTQAGPDEVNEKNPSESNKIYLKIPNEEIKSIFADTVAAWFTDNVKTIDRAGLFHAFWDGNDMAATNIVTDILFDTISYHDYKEDYYHAFLAGIFSGAGYAVESNHEYGLGRPDIIVRDKKNRRVIIIEAKHSDSRQRMQTDAETALDQIDAKKYACQFLKGYHTILCYGAAFCEKECLIKKIDVNQ